MFVSWSLVVIIWQAGFPLKSNTAHPPRLLFFNWKLFVHSRHKFSFRFEVVTTCIAIKTLLTVFKTDPNQTENVSKHYMAWEGFLRESECFGCCKPSKRLPNFPKPKHHLASIWKTPKREVYQRKERILLWFLLCQIITTKDHETNILGCEVRKMHS